MQRVCYSGKLASTAMEFCKTENFKFGAQQSLSLDFIKIIAQSNESIQTKRKSACCIFTYTSRLIKQSMTFRKDT
jgi:hypothetical protein